ncbi:MAG: hypothetical protein GC202_09215 [Alphaproteobacteria bacterium]|nr:hypothetical protein [Alphaproteobacteria bacterium]
MVAREERPGRHRALTGLALGMVFALAACAPGAPPGAVVDPATGLAYGSVVEKSIVVDAAQFRNRRIRVVTRNTSGDLAFDMGGFAGQLRSSYAGKGYQPTDGDDFGIRVDLNVLRSSQVTVNYSTEFAFLGGAGGAIAGRRSDIAQGTAIGLVSGATLGAIAGTYATKDTYIVVAEISVAIMDSRTGFNQRTITFSDSPRLEERETDIRTFRQVARTRVAVYAGGRNVAQAQIAEEVRRRLARIAADII